MNARPGIAALMSVCLLAAACSMRQVPIIGGPADLRSESVRSIKTVVVHRIAVMPVIEARDPTDKTAPPIADGAAEAVSAELYSQMAIEGGWEIVPDGDVARAMQKLPPTTPGNEQDNALALGRDVSADAVLYGTVERYTERVGVDYAAASPAAVTFTLHLIDATSKQVIWSASFAKSQKALTDNMTNLVSFVQNQGRWVRAHEIAMQGVKEAVNDLHSQLALGQGNVKRFEVGTYQQLKEHEYRYGGEGGAP
jgi:hypothetical protein